ncbi:MAG: carbohydrate porin [Fusobacteriaceae bacterium]
MNKRLLTLIGSILLVGGTIQAKEALNNPAQTSESSIETRLQNLESVEPRLAFLEDYRIKNGVDFHGYFRTGSDGNFNKSYKKTYDRNKNLLGRWGNEYDTFIAFNFSKRFVMENGAYAKAFIELENWNNDFGNGQEPVLAAAVVQMGDIPVFTGAFKNAVVTAGKQSWNNRAVDMTDYFYQDMDGVGLGLDAIKLGEGKLGLSYITTNADDATDSYYRPSVDTGNWNEDKDEDLDISDSLRAARMTYAINDLSLELVYAHAADNESYGVVGCGDDKFSRDSAENGVYTGIYYNPQSFYGAKGSGQHYAQFATGLLAGSGLGRLNTQGNFLAHKDSKAFQIGTGGATSLTDKLSIMTALRYQNVTDLDSREYQLDVNDFTKGTKSNKIKDLSEVGFSVRPVYAINSYFDLWVEAGVAKVDRELYNGTEEENFIWKLSAGPQLKLNFGFAETSVRAYVTYYNEESKKSEIGVKSTKDTTDDVIGGFQMSIWF